MARNWPRPGVAALLTGMFHDGAQGMLALRRQGWHTIAQDESSSVVWGMPRAAIELGAADEVLHVDQIAEGIARMVREQVHAPASAAVGIESSESGIGNPPRRNPPGASRMSTEPVLTEHKVTVLLIDDQPMIGEAVRRMLAGEPDVVFHYCRDAAKALDEAHRVQPTVILQDLVMPEIDGLTLVKTFRANEPTRETPMIVLSTKEEPTVKAEAFAMGANDYIVKLPDRLELLARIRYHSKGYINLLQRNEAYDALLESQRRLANEIHQAAHYVRSLLPDKLKKGDVRTDWRFVPSAELGGDSFGYHWLDDDHFAFFLLDVSGHGVGSALLSVSAMNALRSQRCPRPTSASPTRCSPRSTTPSRWTSRTACSSPSGTASITSRAVGSTTPAAATRPPCS